jgi:hypothetical protein
MATPRKSASAKPLTIEVSGSGPDLPAAIETISATPGTSVIQLTLNGSTLKAATDRIRRIPRQRGLNALTVKAREAGDGSYVLEVTNTGKTATPWPKKAAAAKTPAKKATAKKATAKTPAKKATAKSPAKTATAKKATAAETTTAK